MAKDGINSVKKYTAEELTKLQVKLNGGAYSDSWMKKHFRQLIAYAKWVNASPGGFPK